MIGSIAGDIIGSLYEYNNIKTKQFELFQPHSHFTDGTIHTVALAETILDGGSYVDRLHKYFDLYPHADYGGMFHMWASAKTRIPYGSWGNDSAMRVSPVGYAYDSLDETLDRAAESAAVTHDHPEGIKGAQAVAAAIFMARTGKERDWITAFIGRRFEYDLSETISELRRRYSYNVSCQGTVPPALRVVLASRDYEHAVRLAISIGGDSDTIACIVGGIAQAIYGGVPELIKKETLSRLDDTLRSVTLRFCETYGCG